MQPKAVKPPTINQQATTTAVRVAIKNHIKGGCNPKNILLALSSSVLLALSFPNYNHGWLIWLALIPLILSSRGHGFAPSFMLGLLTGTAAAFGIFLWIFEVPGFRWFHFIILGLYLGLYPAVWCGGLSIFKRDKHLSLITVPALWCSLDYLKAHAGFLAFPWASLAHSQHENLPFIQLASYTGEYGLTFLIVLINYIIAGSIATKTWRPLILPAISVIVVHCWGFVELSLPDTGKQLKVTVVQPSFTKNERRNDEDLYRSVERLGALTLSGAADHSDLVVWPETAVGKMDADIDVRTAVRHISEAVDAPIITGSSEVIKFAKRSEIQNSVQFDHKIYNSVYFVPPKRPMPDPYRKRRLVPFSEYIPKVGFAWPKWLVSNSFNITPGDKYVHFPIGERHTISPIICWENLFADYIMALVKEGSDIIVQVTNDNRFGDTGAPYQHNIASVFRAVENRTPVVIASNTGPSQIIDQSGRVVASVPFLFKKSVATASLSLKQRTTFYTRFGDIFCKLCAIITLVGICFRCLTFKKGKNLII